MRLAEIFFLVFCIGLVSASPVLKKPHRDLSKYQDRRVLYPHLTRKVNNNNKPQRKAFQGKVVGGQEAEPHSWPHMVALFIDETYFCGGQVINSMFVMTAAHCAENAFSIQIVAGAHDLTQNEPMQEIIYSYDFKIHELWNPFIIRDDIALLRLPYPLPMNEFISTVSLPNADLAVGDIVTATGWGLDSDSSAEISNVLRQTDNNIISNEECNSYYNIVGPGGVCIGTEGGHGTCSGDSGGPLNKDGVTHGICSFGASAGCEEFFPAGFTRVFHYLNWIQTNSGVTPPPL